MHAVTASGDRTASLRQLRMPATGDPRSQRSAGPPRRRPRHRPGDPRRPTQVIPGMGHDLPRELWPTFVEEIAGTGARAGGRSAATRPRPTARTAQLA